MQYRTYARIALSAAAGIALAASLGDGARAEAPTLKFGTTAPPGSHIAKWFDGWTAEANKVNPAALHVKVYHNTLGNTRTMYDSIKNGVADFGWFNPSYFAGQFSRIYVTTLPGIGVKAEYGSVALWRMNEKGMFKDEFSTVHPIAFHAYPPSSLQTTYPVKSIDDIKGHKFGIISRTDGQLIELLGATPISVGLYAFYQSLQNHVIDGITIGWTAFAPFKLGEVTNYHFDLPLGGSAPAIAFNLASWKALSADARTALMSKAGEYMSRGMGKFWDRVADIAEEKTLKMKGHHEVKFSEADKEKIFKTIEPAYKEWMEKTPDAKALAAAYRSEYAKAAGEKMN
jgi:TRAP-type C4-dicarboxylate transport system substrate-binding protein